MSRAIEELASAGVHDKVFEITTSLPGTNDTNIIFVIQKTAAAA